MPVENLKILYDKKGELQKIQLFENEDGNLMLCLDKYIQFVEGKDEQIYHDNITRPAFKLNPKAKRFLILGGGDGLVARNIIRLNPNAHITVVDIDREVVKLCRTHPRIIELNEGSLELCYIYYADAYKWVKRKNKFDIIILDLPDANYERLKRLYGRKFLERVIKLLDNNGVLSMQVHDNIKERIYKILKDLLDNIQIIGFKMPYLNYGNVIIGNKKCH